MPGAGPTFCIDLRFWYPDRDDDFTEVSSEGQRNKEGAGVSVDKQRRMAYALWNFGRSASRDQQAAVMLYVHGLMGDGAPGEADPGAIGPGVEAIHDRIARDAARFHGPYRLDARVPGGLTAGTRATGTVRLLSADGNAVPGVEIALTATGAGGVPARVRTDASGATVTFTPTAGSGVSIEARSESIASTLPRIFRPTTAAAARNGQRLAAAASQRVSATATQVSSKATIAVTTTAFSARQLVGRANRGRVTITGLPRGRRTQITSALFGPFRTREAIRCTGTPIWRGTVTATGDGTVRTAATALPRVGLYTYRERVAGSETVTATRTDCGLVEETALALPAVNTGRGDVAGGARELQASPPRPTRVSLGRLGIDAPVAAVGIDLRAGALDVPVDIRRTGWWRDGAAPGDPRGAVLIAGHVDSAARGPGAFFRLKDARAGDRVQVRTADGRARSYRVTSVRTVLKGRLPTDVYSLKGRSRLVLVTCGGPFDPAAGRYVDNIVVTAVPAG